MIWKIVLSAISLGLIYLGVALSDKKDFKEYKRYLKDEITILEYKRYKQKSDRVTALLSVLTYLVLAVSIYALLAN